jgi:hypothetical protein
MFAPPAQTLETMREGTFEVDKVPHYIEVVFL